LTSMLMMRKALEEAKGQTICGLWLWVKFMLFHH
jgi:hypothetical protein